MDENNNKNCLTKAELSDAIYNIMQIDKQKSVKIVEDYSEIIKDALIKEGKVMLSGFGTFTVKSKNARKGRNPQTGGVMILEPRKVVKFKESQILRKAMNQQAR